MKIRYGMFETNSSSTHSIVLKNSPIINNIKNDKIIDFHPGKEILNKFYYANS
jgi:hypothetical protein